MELDLNFLLRVPLWPPEFLTDDVAMRERIRAHPALLWKSVNVRGHTARGA